MITCKHCKVRIEKIETAGAGEIWLHTVDGHSPVIPAHIYQECKHPRTVAEP